MAPLALAMAWAGGTLSSPPPSLFPTLLHLPQPSFLLSSSSFFLSPTLFWLPPLQIGSAGLWVLGMPFRRSSPLKSLSLCLRSLPTSHPEAAHCLSLFPSPSHPFFRPSSYSHSYFPTHNRDLDLGVLGSILTQDPTLPAHY